MLRLTPRVPDDPFAFPVGFKGAISIFFQHFLLELLEAVVHHLLNLICSKTRGPTIGVKEARNASELLPVAQSLQKIPIHLSVSKGRCGHAKRSGPKCWVRREHISGSLLSSAMQAFETELRGLGIATKLLDAGLESETE